MLEIGYEHNSRSQFGELCPANPAPVPPRPAFSRLTAEVVPKSWCDHLLGITMRRTAARIRQPEAAAALTSLVLLLLVAILRVSSAFVQPPPQLPHVFINQRPDTIASAASSLQMSKLDPSGSGKRKGETDVPPDTPVRYLGKGERAIIRPGVVMVAPSHESSHFLMKSAVFVYAMGLNEYGEHVTRGVIIDHPTAFTMGEMGGGSVVGVLGNNILFRGGEQGNDSALLLHSHGDTIKTGPMIGNSGVYEGGLQASMEAADEGEVDPDNFKFFFNYMQFSDNEIESMLEMEDSAGDAWMSVEVPSGFVLNSDYGRGEAWSYLRNQIKEMLQDDA